ncbi:hypothetical protein CSKR_106792 [Clonorchis sinensis]|uniref:Uncharacterized protein n=1 Tax=Clonorchis sinensis TaxID=79923 RepID=A0A3R7C9C4_CLOSI|nr:hypothetical protein CSKR_106792 [Clonorchis sinensis]
MATSFSNAATSGVRCISGSVRGEMAQVRGSNPTSASRLPLSRLGQPHSIPTLMLPSGSMTARHRKDVTAERFSFFFHMTSSACEYYSSRSSPHSRLL